MSQILIEQSNFAEDCTIFTFKYCFGAFNCSACLLNNVGADLQFLYIFCSLSRYVIVTGSVTNTCTLTTWSCIFPKSQNKVFMIDSYLI